MSRPFRDVAGRPKGPLTGESWNQRWVDQDTPWDMGRTAPPFERAVRDGLVPVGGRALVPGCGAGHDARFLAEAGFDVTGVDLSETALARARALAAEAGTAVTYRQADLLALPDDLAGFDLVLEHTCFCAIDPERRDDYVASIAGAVRPGGHLLGLFFLFEAEEGPPFGATQEEIEHRFGAHFDVLHVERPDDSHEARQGREGLFVLRRRVVVEENT